MKKLSVSEKRANELEALNNALNYHKNEIEEFNNAYFQVDERNKKRPYHLIFTNIDGKEIESSCECNYMEMNAFIQGVWRYKNVIEKFKNHVPKTKYILSDNSINGVEINESIFDEEMFEYRIIHRQSFIDELYGWIGHANGYDKELMIDDVEMLSEVKDEYIFSSISTNEYIYSGCSNFEETCEELLELNKTL